MHDKSMSLTASVFSSNAVLIYGPRKSGSSLLHNLLDGGSQVLMLPGELKIKGVIRKTTEPDALVKQYVKRGRLDFSRIHNGAVRDASSLRANRAFNFCGLTEEQTNTYFDIELYVQRLRDMLLDPPDSYGSIVRRDVANFCEALKPKPKHYSRWAAKEVGGNTEEIIAFFRNAFPKMQVVYLVRDPRFIVRSIILDRRRKGIRLSFNKVWDECVRAQGIIDFIYNRASNDDIVVAYERLTKDTETQMRRLAAHLNIPFEPILCVPTTLGLPVIVRTSSHKTNAVFNQITDWRTNLTQSQIAAITFYRIIAASQFHRGGQKNIPYSVLLTRHGQ